MGRENPFIAKSNYNIGFAEKDLLFNCKPRTKTTVFSFDWNFDISKFNKIQNNLKYFRSRFMDYTFLKLGVEKWAILFNLKIPVKKTVVFFFSFISNIVKTKFQM